MLRPRKMKFIELTVFKKDMDSVIEYLGKKAMVQFPESEGLIENHETARIKEIIHRLSDAAEYIDTYHSNNELNDNVDEVSVPAMDTEKLTNTICTGIENLKNREITAIHERQHIRETINEAKAFSKMNVSFSDFEHLSYLTLRIGRLDQKGVNELKEALGNRSVIIPLNTDNLILAACSKKGRFALDTQLKKVFFEPVNIHDNFRGVPAEMMKSMKEQVKNLELDIEKIKNEREQLNKTYSKEINKLFLSWKMALTIEEIKARFTATESLYHFSGWTPSDTVPSLARDLSEKTGGRVAIHVYSPNEVASVKANKEKVPVAMKHNSFVKGFESIVFSYGAPLYGTIDPTPLVAFFFTIMFGIMFGDVGQGFVLFLAGVIIGKFKKKYVKLSKFSIPLISVGIASMIMGLLAGAVFTNEKLLIGPTRIITSAITGNPMDRILHILPLAGEGGSITKLLYFFGFTIAIGVIINSLGLIINIFNRCILKKYQAAFFSKTGLAGLLLFWYALFIIIKILFGGKFEMYDFAGIFIPVFFIFFGPIIWRIISGERPVLEAGFLTFVMEGFVEIMETFSTYFSNTISFLRIGAFALAHAVFSFIIFYFTEQLAHSGPGGTISAVLIMIIGNVIIIVLEGLIVAIQVIRLQYYEFFNKFLIETGVEFAPFRFRNKESI
ncbi:MAG: V-type ATP synthase subunit I [Treponema sp.]|nr:V-type ATP synthase subunit I [Treponema sp.]